MRRIRSIAVAMLAVATLGLTACDPLPPAVFAVTTPVDGSDADPGDGVCEMTGGAGDCSLRAGIDEANALGALDDATRVVLQVPSGDYVVPATLEVTGDLAIIPQDPAAAPPRLDLEELRISAGANLTVRQIAFEYGAAVGTVVHGALVLDRVSILAIPSYPLRISATGVLVMLNSYGGSFATPVVDNAGVAAIHQSTLEPNLGIGVRTQPGGTTYLQATALLSPVGPRWPPGSSTACTGEAPISLGYNTAWGATCPFASVGDQNNINPSRPVINDIDINRPHAPDSPLVDAIPVGAAGCGDTLAPDRLGVIRPVDGNGDGIAACDIGDLERATP